MRANSIASKMMKSYSTLVGKQFLTFLFGEMISNICHENISNGKTRFLLDMAQTKVVNSIGVSIQYPWRINEVPVPNK